MVYYAQIFKAEVFYFVFVFCRGVKILSKSLSTKIIAYYSKLHTGITFSMEGVQEIKVWDHFTQLILLFGLLNLKPDQTDGHIAISWYSIMDNDMQIFHRRSIARVAHSTSHASHASMLNTLCWAPMIVQQCIHDTFGETS